MDANSYSTVAQLAPLLFGVTRVVQNASREDQEIFELFNDEERRDLMIVRIFAYCIGILIILSNLIVVISSGLILRKGSQCKSTFLLLGNASLADALIGANVLLGVSVRHHAVSHAMCVLQIGLIVSPTLVSIYSVGLIAADRYLYILHGLHYRRWINTTRVRISIVATWIIGLSVGFLPAAGWSGDSLGGRKCWYISISPYGLITLISLVGLFPIIAVCILYSIILFHALRKVTQLRKTVEHGKQLQDSEPSVLRLSRGKYAVDSSRLSIHTISSSVDSVVSIITGASQQNKTKTKSKVRKSVRKQNVEPNKWRAIKVVMLTSGSIVCTWVPYFITTLIYVLCDKETERERCSNIELALATPLAVLGLLNSLFNPLIYAWWNQGFKTALTEIMCKFFNTCICKKANK